MAGIAHEKEACENTAETTTVSIVKGKHAVCTASPSVVAMCATQLSCRPLQEASAGDLHSVTAVHMYTNLMPKVA